MTCLTDAVFNRLCLLRWIPSILCSVFRQQGDVRLPDKEGCGSQQTGHVWKHRATLVCHTQQNSTSKIIFSGWFLFSKLFPSSISAGIGRLSSLSRAQHRLRVVGFLFLKSFTRGTQSILCKLIGKETRSRKRGYSQSTRNKSLKSKADAT